MFHFPRYAPRTITVRDGMGLPCRVSPFGHPRIKGCYTPPRGLSQLRRVLHRHVVSRHPPHTLNLRSCDLVVFYAIARYMHVFVFSMHSRFNKNSLVTEAATEIQGKHTFHGPWRLPRYLCLICIIIRNCRDVGKKSQMTQGWVWISWLVWIAPARCPSGERSGPLGQVLPSLAAYCWDVLRGFCGSLVQFVFLLHKATYMVRIDIFFLFC
jgi:hypothetical protein